MPSYFLLFFLLFLGACSQSGKGTPVALRLTVGSISGPVGVMSEGGFAFYGKASDGRAFGRVITATNTPITFELPNGVWTFYALAWQGDGSGTFEPDQDVMKGQVRCAETAPMTLNGTAVTLALNLTNAQCDATTTFKGSLAMAGSAPKNFKFPQIKICKDLSWVTSGSDICQYDLAGSIFTKGYASGVRFSLRSFDMSPAGTITWQGSELTGECFSDSNSNAAGTATVNTSGTNYNIPHLTTFPLGLSAKLFYGTSESTACDANYGESAISIPHGTRSQATADGVDTVKGYDTGGGSTLHTYLRVDEKMACNATKVNPNTWAGGYGSEFVPYLICKNENLDNLRGSSYTSNSAAHLILLKNLNYWYGLNPQTDSPPDIPPLGETLPAPATAFVGSFNGNNKFIIGWNSEVPSSNDIKQDMGFFRSVGSGAKIFDFTMISPEIRKDYSNRLDNVGVVAGKSLGEIKNVIVRGARIEGSVSVGGLVGKQDSQAHIRDSKIYDSDIEGTVYVGGLVGHSAAWNGTGGIILQSGVYDSQIASNSYNHTRCVDLAQDSSQCVDANEQWENGYCTLTAINLENNCITPSTAVWLQGNAIGGLIGKADDANIPTLLRCRASGIVKAHSMAGGLIGKATADIAIQDSYATTSVITTTKNTITGFKNRAGGLVGKWFSGGVLSITRSYHDKGGISHILPDSLPLVGEGSFTASQAFAHTTATPGTLIGGVSGTANYDEAGMFADATYDTSWDPSWSHNDIGLAAPILAWEDSADHPCIGKRSALGGSGTTSDPYLICTRAQFNSLNGSTAKFKLLDEIDFRDSSATNVISSFSGALDGNRHGMNNFYKAGIANAAIFASTTSLSKLENFFASNIQLNDPSIVGGATIVINHAGVINNALVYGHLNLQGQAGGVVKVNNGVILRTESNIQINIDSSNGNTLNVGGIASENNGIIGLSESRSDISVTTSTNTASYIGGIAGHNDGSIISPVTATIKAGETITDAGLIFESSFQGMIETNGNAPITEIGGIVGENRADGIIRDTFAEWGIKDTTNSASVSTINDMGGLAGALLASSLIEKSWARLTPSFAQDATGSSLYPAAPVAAEAVNLRYMDQSTTMYSDFDTGSGSRVITGTGTNGTPPGSLYASNLASFSGWDISDDEENETTWIIHSGDNFGPRLYRAEEHDDHMKYFDVYGTMTP